MYRIIHLSNIISNKAFFENAYLNRNEVSSNRTNVILVINCNENVKFTL